MNSAAGKMKGAVKQIGVSMKSVVVKKTEGSQIRRGFGRRSVAVMKSVGALMRNAVERPLASPSGWLASGRWRTNAARKRRLARGTAGRIDPRCFLELLHTWRISTDLPM
jgi:hypothetical protein